MTERIAFRSLVRHDLPALQRWLNTPHVYEWWGVTSGPDSLGGAGADAATDAQMKAKYGAPLDHGDTTHRHIITVDERPIGLIQWYRLADEPEYAAQIGETSPGGAGIDLLIGEIDATGRGLGPAVLDCYVTAIVFADVSVIRVIGAPHPSNKRSCRAFEKAGFVFAREVDVPNEGPERVHVRMR